MANVDPPARRPRAGGFNQDSGHDRTELETEYRRMYDPDFGSDRFDV